MLTSPAGGDAGGVPPATKKAGMISGRRKVRPLAAGPVGIGPDPGYGRAEPIAAASISPADAPVRPIRRPQRVRPAARRPAGRAPGRIVDPAVRRRRRGDADDGPVPRGEARPSRLPAVLSH